jgi:hypothetical protein
MNKRVLAAMLAALALGLAGGCEHSGRGGKSDAGSGSIVYTGTTAKNETLTLTITEKAGSANILASEAGGDEGAAVYRPKTGDTYTITIADELVSSGTVYVSAAAWIITFYAGGDTGKSFYAALTAEDGGRTLKFSTAIKTIDGGTVSVSSMTAAVTPIAPWTPVAQPPAPPAPPAYTPPPYVPAPVPDPPDPTYGIELSVTENHTFPDAGEGYGAIASQPITIRNTGNQSTGALTVTLSGANAASFKLNNEEYGATITVTSIAAGGSRPFTVTPEAGLAVETYTATVTVKGDSNIEERSFNVIFSVEGSARITLSKTDNSNLTNTAHSFADAIEGYSELTPLEVTITNTGTAETGALKVALEGTDSDSFTLSPTQTTIDNIGINGSNNFTVVPNNNLVETETYTYTATGTVSAAGGNTNSIAPKSFTVSFKVIPAFAALVAQMAEEKAETSKSYTLPSGAETYTPALTLTRANSPASVTIDGGGRVITGNGSGITIGEGVTLTLRNITFSNIPFTVAGGGTLVLNNGAFIQDNMTTGVTVNGTLEMNAGSVITNNSNSSSNRGSAGGGVSINGGMFTMNGGEISGNSAGSGGGVQLDSGTFTMSGGEISGNSASGYGGGVYMHQNSKFTMYEGAIITRNSASVAGGGVLLLFASVTFDMNGGEISGNTADNGGGVALRNGGTTNMSGGSIKNNTAGNGGGVWIGNYETTFKMTGGEITGNKSGGTGGVYGTINEGDPTIGGTTAPASGGWIHGNTKTDGTPSNLSDGDE